MAEMRTRPGMTFLFPTGQTSQPNSPATLSAPKDSASPITRDQPEIRSPGISRNRKAQPSRKGRLSRRAIDNIINLRRNTMMADCGCITFPGAAARIADTILCDTHGWQKYRSATVGESMAAMGIEITCDSGKLPEEPPF